MKYNFLTLQDRPTVNMTDTTPKPLAVNNKYNNILVNDVCKILM